MGQILFESLPKDVAALPSRVLSSLTSVKLLDMMEPEYKKFSMVSGASPLRVILATSVLWLMMTVFLTLILRTNAEQVLDKQSMIDCS